MKVSLGRTKTAYQQQQNSENGKTSAAMTKKNLVMELLRSVSESYCMWASNHKQLKGRQQTAQTRVERQRYCTLGRQGHKCSC